MPRKRHTPEQVMKEVQVLTETYRQTYNHTRPHNCLGYRPPAPETFIPAFPQAAELT